MPYYSDLSDMNLQQLRALSQSLQAQKEEIRAQQMEVQAAITALTQRDALVSRLDGLTETEKAQLVAMIYPNGIPTGEKLGFFSRMGKFLKGRRT